MAAATQIVKGDGSGKKRGRIFVKLTFLSPKKGPRLSSYGICMKQSEQNQCSPSLAFRPIAVMFTPHFAPVFSLFLEMA